MSSFLCATTKGVIIFKKCVFVCVCARAHVYFFLLCCRKLCCCYIFLHWFSDIWTVNLCPETVCNAEWLLSVQSFFHVFLASLWPESYVMTGRSVNIYLWPWDRCNRGWLYLLKKNKGKAGLSLDSLIMVPEWRRKRSLVNSKHSQIQDQPTYSQRGLPFEDQGCTYKHTGTQTHTPA